jgi:hypothetical protein
VFNQGDLIQVTDDDDDEWWKGFILSKSVKEEGYFPRRHVRLLSPQQQPAQIQQPVMLTSYPHSSNLDEFAWFAPVDRQTADLILSRITNPFSQTIFMVRCRQEGGYAISIKYNGFVDHIKINVSFLAPNSGALDSGVDSTNVSTQSWIIIRKLISTFSIEFVF